MSHHFFSLSWANIKEMYAELLIPKEFEELYFKIAGDDKQLQLHEFKDFLRDFQKEKHHSDEQLQKMILEYEKTDLDTNTNLVIHTSTYERVDTFSPSTPPVL